MHFSLRVISFAWYKRRGSCQIGLYYEVYYRHLAHLSDRLGSLEVAISLIRKINYRPASGLDYFGHSFDPQPLLLKYRRRSRVNRFQLVILPHFLEKYHKAWWQKNIIMQVIVAKRFKSAPLSFFLEYHLLVILIIFNVIYVEFYVKTNGHQTCCNQS